MGSDPTGLPLRLEGHGRGALITPEDAERLRRSAIFKPSRLNLRFYRAIFPLNDAPHYFIRTEQEARAVLAA